MKDQQHRKPRQAYFLHRKAADTLQDILIENKQPEFAGAARDVLIRCLSKSGSTALRAAAEALGSLPISLSTPTLPFFEHTSRVPDISWTALLERVSTLEEQVEGHQLDESHVYAPVKGVWPGEDFSI